MKKAWILIVVVILAIIGWYFISPAFSTIEVNEESPLIINDDLDSMTKEEKQEFEAAVEEMQDDVIEGGDDMPSEAQLISEGLFMPRAHEVEGSALLIEDNGKNILRFEDFETINGPNLHIYLSSDLGDDDFIDLGEIKATKGSVNYDIPEGVDLDKYNKVLVWCVPFKVLFSYADLV